MFLDIDVRDIVPSVHVPALILHRRHDRLVNIGNGRWLAEHLPNAKLIELPGGDRSILYEGTGATLAEVQEFLTGTRYAPEPERTLATVLFTDIVDSTRHADELGAERWRDLVGEHNRKAAGAIDRHRGRLVKTTGDGVLAEFDGAERAVRGAAAIRDAAESLGLATRAGVHTGEVQTIAGDVRGIAVHTAARIMAIAGSGEVLVSATVMDLLDGSGLTFEDAGLHELKGLPRPRQLYRLATLGAG